MLSATSSAMQCRLEVPLLYGGSVNPSNAASFAAQPNVQRRVWWEAPASRPTSSSR